MFACPDFGFCRRNPYRFLTNSDFRSVSDFVSECFMTTFTSSACQRFQLDFNSRRIIIIFSRFSDFSIDFPRDSEKHTNFPRSAENEFPYGNILEHLSFLPSFHPYIFLICSFLAYLFIYMKTENVFRATNTLRARKPRDLSSIPGRSRNYSLPHVVQWWWHATS
jgi:hypothetical protein